MEGGKSVVAGGAFAFTSQRRRRLVTNHFALSLDSKTTAKQSTITSKSLGMSAAHPAEPAATMNGAVQAVPVPLAGEPAQPSALAEAGPASVDMHHDDENMTDDMRLAISALGLMREGSLSGKSPTPTSATVAPFPLPLAQDGQQDNRNGIDGATHTYGPGDARGRSDSRVQSDPSRSASTASMASYSEAWTGSHTHGTGYSSPATSMHLHQQYENGTGPGTDAAMADETGQAGDDDPHFMTRVSQLPIVSGGIEWYERSKANSRVVKVWDPAFCRAVAGSVD